MKAYVLIETTPGKAKSIKRTLGKLKGGATEIAVIEGPSLDALGQLVTESLGTIDGVTRTTTCIAVSIG